MEIPTAINSTAAQGNFLEVLNMSLNGEHHNYIQLHKYIPYQLLPAAPPTCMSVIEVKNRLFFPQESCSCLDVKT